MAGNINSEALNIQEMHSQIYFWREFCSLSLKWIIETHIVESQFGYSVKKCLTAMITKPMQLSLDAVKWAFQLKILLVQCSVKDYQTATFDFAFGLI